MVIDYRDVNKKTVKDSYQIAQVRVLINRLKGAKFFSKFDAKSGFWQVKIQPESIALTAFGTPQGHYKWLVMPFGLKQASSIFQKKMDNIFKPYSDFCIVYIDDILVFSRTMNEHLKHLEQVCKLIVQKGIILGQKKIHLIKGEIDFLGIYVKDGEIRLQEHIVKKISQFPDNIPDAKSLQRFLGVVNFARDFIPQVSSLTALLSPKTSSKKKWSFTKDDSDKNYLPDAVTREMKMFEREGRNPRNRKPVSEEKKIWERYKNGDKTIGPLNDGPGYQYIVSYGAAESSQLSERIKPRLDQGWDELENKSMAPQVTVFFHKLPATAAHPSQTGHRMTFVIGHVPITSAKAKLEAKQVKLVVSAVKTQTFKAVSKNALRNQRKRVARGPITRNMAKRIARSREAERI
ncbi:PREDICTED: enzymatic polyprotein-like [Fragaria vesca subsp. vesca]